jgi:hypothetical protein
MATIALLEPGRGLGRLVIAMPIFFASPARAAPDPPGLILSAAQAAAQRFTTRKK